MRFKSFYTHELLESCARKVVFDNENLIVEKETMQERLTNKYGITEFEKTSPDHSVNSIGFSPKLGKWFGFSHRAIYGFKKGSTCKMGDCHFKPSNKEEFLESLKKWYDDPMYKDVELNHTKTGVHIKYTTKSGIGEDRIEKYPTKWGKGEWTAKSMEDAKQMAIDFAEGVS